MTAVTEAVHPDPMQVNNGSDSTACQFPAGYIPTARDVDVSCKRWSFVRQTSPAPISSSRHASMQAWMRLMPAQAPPREPERAADVQHALEVLQAAVLTISRNPFVL